jgi:NlpC/P60 family putative phage cell wall peptidase
MTTIGQRSVAIARTWLGTPFLAGASVAGVGTDCAGLIEGVARHMGVAYPARGQVEQDLLRAAATVLVPSATPDPGTIILLSAQPSGPPLHAAIVTETGTLIHAHWRAGVVENRFGNWFVARITHIFAWAQTSTLKDN